MINGRSFIRNPYSNHTSVDSTYSIHVMNATFCADLRVYIS